MRQPQNSRSIQTAAVIQREVTVTRSAPLPTPEEMSAYKDMIPDGANRIMAMAELEQTHRHSQERLSLQNDANDRVASRMERRRGQYCGLVLGVTALIASCIASIHGHPLAAGFLGTGGVGSLVLAFLIDHNQKQTAQTPN